MIHSSASFTFFKKSKSLHVEVSGLCACGESVNRPPILYYAQCAQSTDNLRHQLQRFGGHRNRHAESLTAPTLRGTN